MKDKQKNRSKSTPHDNPEAMREVLGLNKKEAREKTTVAQLLDDNHFHYDRVPPLQVRFWLERYVEEGDSELEDYSLEVGSGAMDQARLIYDVLQSKYLGTGEYEFPEAARDYIEEYLYRLAQSADVQVWNYPEAAIASLATLLCCANSSTDDQTDTVALTAAVEALSTRRERRHFLKSEEGGDVSEDDRNHYAGFKLSRTLADPATPTETRIALEEAILKFHMSSQVCLYHPALVQRGFALMCDAKPKGRVREAERDRKRLLALLDSICEEKGGDL